MIAAVSDFVRRDFQSVYPGIRNIQVLYNTIETDKILKLKDEELPENLFSNEEFKSHLNECDLKCLECRFCQMEIILRDLNEHEYVCGSKTEICISLIACS